MFILLESLLPLSTAVKIGADEDFELSKAPLAEHGYKLYTDVWSDQPPLYAFVLTALAKRCSYSVVYPRLLTASSAALLLSALYLVGLRWGGLAVGGLAATFLIASPGFVELSSSAMQEVPALAPVVGCLAVLLAAPRTKRFVAEMCAGMLFAVGLQLKLIGIVYAPLVLLAMFLRRRSGEEGVRAGRGGTRPYLAIGASVFLAVSILTFLAINWLTGARLWLELQQSWFAHFVGQQSFDYGSPAEHTFEWSVLLKNWDITVPAAVGVFAIVRSLAMELPRFGRVQGGKPQRHEGRGEEGREEVGCDGYLQHLRGGFILFPVAWLALTLIVFPLHKPWWAYYYVHNSIPLCLCAAIGVQFVVRALAGVRAGAGGRKVKEKNHGFTQMDTNKGRKARRRRRLVLAGILGVYALATAAWIGGRVWLQVDSIRKSPKLYAALVLNEIERFKPFTQFMFTDQPIYSFHSGIPVPPHLAIISLKRFWSGDMTNARLVEELKQTKPGLMLLANDTRELPFQDLLNREYRLVYEDGANRLYAHQSIVKKARY